MRVEARGYGRPSVSEHIGEIVERHIGEVENWRVTLDRHQSRNRAL